MRFYNKCDGLWQFVAIHKVGVANKQYLFAEVNGGMIGYSKKAWLGILIFYNWLKNSILITYIFYWVTQYKECDFVSKVLKYNKKSRRKLSTRRTQILLKEEICDEVLSLARQAHSESESDDRVLERTTFLMFQK